MRFIIFLNTGFREIRLFLLLSLLCGFSIANAHESKQSIALKKGWNAVYLQIDPTLENQNLTSYIKSTNADAIEVIATYYSPLSSVEYLSDPTEEAWKDPSWNKWIRGDLPDSFLTNLFDLEAGRGYLIKSTKDFVWDVTGQVSKIKTRWQPNAFNFLGFQVQDDGPSFHQLLSDNTSAAPLKNGPIYHLVNGFWEVVSMPDVKVEKDKAYWLFSDGAAEFQGGIAIEIQGGKSVIDFADVSGQQKLTLTNTSSRLLTAVLSLVDNEVPLSLETEKLGDGETEETYQIVYKPVEDEVVSLSIEAGGYEDVLLLVRRNDLLEAGEKTGLLKVSIPETYEEFLLPISVVGVVE